jgi:hypothetical protein
MPSSSPQRTHTSTPSCDVQLDQPISDEVAEQQEAALDRVQELLAAHGIHTCSVERLEIRGHSRGQEEPLVESHRYPPQLLVFSDGGWRLATVTVSPRAMAYMVELAQWGEGNEIQPDRVHVVPGDRPERVAVLIPSYQRVTS